MGGGERERAAVWSAAALHIRDWIQRCCQSDAIGKGSIWTSLETYLFIEGKFECFSFSFLLLLLRRRLRCPPSVIHLLPCRREALGQRSQGGRTEGESPPLHSPSILRPCLPAKLLLARTGIHPPPSSAGRARSSGHKNMCLHFHAPCQMSERGRGREGETRSIHLAFFYGVFRPPRNPANTHIVPHTVCTRFVRESRWAAHFAKSSLLGFKKIFHGFPRLHVCGICYSCNLRAYASDSLPHSPLVERESFHDCRSLLLSHSLSSLSAGIH